MSPKSSLLLAGVVVVSLFVVAGCGISRNTGNSGSSGGGGTTGTGTGNSTATEFLYAIENPGAASTVEAFTISSTGTLTSVGSPLSAGNNANDIVADPSGKFVITGNSSGCCLTARRAPQLISYTVGSTGALTQAEQTDFPNQNDTLNGLLLDPTGADVYAASQNVQIEGEVSSFAADRISANMSLLQPDPSNTIMPGRMAMHPNGKYLYAAILLRHHYPEQGGYALFLRDPATGTITYTNNLYHSSQPLTDFYGDTAMALDGQYLLGVTSDSHKISVWSVNASTGDLMLASELTGNFQGLTVDTTGKFVLATLSDGTVSSYTVNADGSLTQAGTAAATAGVNSIVTDGSGKFVYAENSQSSQIYGFAFDPTTGALTTVPGSPFATSGAPIRMATAATK